MPLDAQDLRLRLAAFEHVRKITGPDGLVSWHSISAGFVFDGERVALASPARGIFKPRQLKAFPLTILTSFNGPYEDGEGGDGALLYNYQGTDVNGSDNVMLRMAKEGQVPLIYFKAVRKGWYLPIIPAYIVGDEPRRLRFTVQQALAGVRFGVVWEPLPGDESQRRYATTVVQQRLHQEEFRRKVLVAYKESCTVCELTSHPELLDAAHILRDGHPAGRPVVTNGLSLCKLHHAAYDGFLFGIRPDYVIEVNKRVLKETDGPMLVHGLQSIDKASLALPRRPADHPDPEFLEERYEEFREAG